jgi:methylated-DNA-protein-cysteine methyltransferase-like protein
MRRPSRVFVAIWRVVARIPPGRVATYGQVARMAGYPGAARTVGWALGALPGDRTPGTDGVPWHRVINAAGRVSARGPLGDECRRQVARLRREGVRPGRDGAIDLERYGWDGRAASKKPGARAQRPGRGAPGGGRSSSKAFSS